MFYIKKLSASIVFLVLILSSRQTTQDDSEQSDISAEVNDILKMRPNTARLNNDPFFMSSYQSTYDPISALSYIETEPDFAYEADHISPYQVDIIEHSQEKLDFPKKLDAFETWPKEGIR